jgi:predicted transcriptional regulator of viral defense system
MASLSQNRIAETFNLSSERIWTRQQLLRLIQANLPYWGAEPTAEDALKVKHPTATAVLTALVKETPLEQITLDFPYRAVTRFLWGEASTQELIQSADSEGYYSHYTALHMHGLTEQIPKVLYFNVEQPAYGGGGTLSQEGIDRAFRGKCRVTNNVIKFRGYTVYKVNGKNTGCLGVEKGSSSNTSGLRLTDIERTLIDAAVRPVYCGGVGEVAKAYVNAAGNMSVKKLVSYLHRMQYTYPYHQSIGYFMDRSEQYSKADLERLRAFPIEYDFYVDYQLKNPAYNQKWRLHIPKGF